MKVFINVVRDVSIVTKIGVVVGVEQMLRWRIGGGGLVRKS